MTTLPEPRSVAALRAHTNATRHTVDEIAQVVEGVVAADTMDQMCERTGWEPDELRDLIAHLGTWLTHVHGTSPAERIRAEKTTETSHTRRGKNPRVVIPVGFGRQRATRRDTARSYAAVAWWAPDRAELSRYVARRWRPAGAPTAGIVSYVWYSTSLGYVDDLDRHADPDSVWGPAVVAAWDLLEVTRSDAVAAVGRIAAAAVIDCDDVNWDQVAADAQTCRVLDEPVTNRLIRACGIATTGDTTSARMAAHRELRRFVTTATTNPRFSPAWVGDLSGDQTHRIIARAGIAECHEADRSVRDRVESLGLSADIDVILGDLRRAEAAGAADDYWESVERRAAGDDRWMELLDA